MSQTQTGSRTDARSMIEELWAEREQARPLNQPQVDKRPPAPPRPKASPKERALATAIVLLLAGNGLGIGAKAMGLIGAPSKEMFIARADAICAPGNAGLSALSKPSGYPSVATAASTLVTTTETQLGQLRRLELPGFADRSSARGVLDAIAQTAGAGRRLQAGAATTDAAATANASRTMATVATDAAAAAKAFGFTACGAGMEPGINAVLAGANGAVKASFIEKVHPMCAALVRDAEELSAPTLDWYINQSTALYEKFANDLRALPVPPGDEAAVAELAEGMLAVGAKVRELGAAAMNGDLKRVTAIEKEGDVLAEQVDAKFQAYGFNDCGS
jgi:hypothetical protein